jgi:hypothetical protein
MEGAAWVQCPDYDAKTEGCLRNERQGNRISKDESELNVSMGDSVCELVVTRGSWSLARS